MFDLICRGLEGRLSPEQHAIVDDMLNKCGEWFSLLMKRQGNKLYLYFDPENFDVEHIVWDKEGDYLVLEGLKYTSKKVYDIQSLSGWVNIKDLYKVCPDIIETLWSRPYALLPKEIRLYGYIHILSEDGLYPVGRSDHNNDYCISTNYCFRASRGVRTK